MQDIYDICARKEMRDTASRHVMRMRLDIIHRKAMREER